MGCFYYISWTNNLKLRLTVTLQAWKYFRSISIYYHGFFPKFAIPDFFLIKWVQVILQFYRYSTISIVVKKNKFQNGNNTSRVIQFLEKPKNLENQGIRLNFKYRTLTNFVIDGKLSSRFMWILLHIYQNPQFLFIINQHARLCNIINSSELMFLFLFL